MMWKHHLISRVLHCPHLSRCSGEPTVCDKNSASVSLVGCLMEEKNIDYSVLHLNDKTCKGQRDDKTHMVTFSFDSNTCGTVLTVSVSSLLTLS